MQFLSEIIIIRDDVMNLQSGLTLSWHELNAIVLYLATDRLKFLYFCIFFILIVYTVMYDLYFK